MVNRSYVQRIAENHLKNMADRAEMPEVCDELRFGYTESDSYDGRLMKAAIFDVDGTLLDSMSVWEIGRAHV